MLLRDVYARIAALGYRVGNVDLTIVAQKPRLAPYIQAMCGHVAEDLQIETGQVNVKATTTEGMGFEGRGEGISAYAVALIVKS